MMTWGWRDKDLAIVWSVVDVDKSLAYAAIYAFALVCGKSGNEMLSSSFAGTGTRYQV